MSDKLSKNLSLLSKQIDEERLTGLEAKVWETINQNKTSGFGFDRLMLLRVASIALVLFIGGVVGADQKHTDPVLMAFSNAPVYSIMSMIKN